MPAPPMLLVHVEHPSPRATYIVTHVVERMLGIPVRITHDADEFSRAEGPRLQYGGVAIEGVVHVPWSGALGSLPSNDPPVAEQGGMKVLFPEGEGYDLFAAAFFLLSLIDEVRCVERDAHDRVPSNALFTVRGGLAELPWVDRWALALRTELEQRWPGLVKRPRRYRHVVTVDMDNLLRYAGRPLARAVGASLKDLFAWRVGAVAERWMVRAGLRQDPFMNTLEKVADLRSHMDKVCLFLLLRGNDTQDHAVPPAHWPASVRDRIAALHARGIDLGLHPSYRTSEDDDLLENEVRAFTNVIGPLRATRQHFLRMRMPGTFRWLAKARIAEEHSLGFADRSGFRASTCTPFPWYDLEREEETGLTLFPFQAMDSALIERMGLGPDGVERAMNAMSDAVRAVNGTFVSVWHDRYLSGHREFAPWPAAFERVVQHAKA